MGGVGGGGVGVCFFFNDTATTEIYTLSLHDALPIFPGVRPPISTSTSDTGVGAGGETVSAAAWLAITKKHKTIRKGRIADPDLAIRSEEHTSELQSPVPISYAVFCLKKKKNNTLQACASLPSN